jgi:Tfp pilus assembly protein PilN
MTSEQRLAWLKIAAAGSVGVLLLLQFVLTPVTQRWKDQSERIALLREQVERGQLLLDRETAIRDRWDSMLRNNLPADPSAAENELIKAIARWVGESRVALTSLTPLWRPHDQGYQTLECRATATGSQSALSRFLYEMETDPMAVRLETAEITARDDKGQQLTLNARFTALQLANHQSALP